MGRLGDLGFQAVGHRLGVPVIPIAASPCRPYRLAVKSRFRGSGADD